MVMNPTFWKGKRVFITGHTGFKGSWLSLWLTSLGAKVTGYALAPNSELSLFELANIDSLLISIEADVCNVEHLYQALDNCQPEIVFHLAAQSLVRASYDDPLLTYKTNVMGTANLLENIRRLKLPCSLVNITTDKCYENKEWHWGYREIDRLGGFDPYSNSKACSELVTASFRSSFFHPSQFQNHKVALATARAGNVVGGGDWAKDRLIPDMLKALENNQTVDIRYPHAVRPWQHVLEPLHGYLLLAEQLHTAGPQFAKAWNFGPNENDACTVAEVACKLEQLWGKQNAWQAASGQHPHEAHYLRLDISLARNELGWRPMLSIDKAIKLTVDWEKARLNNADVRQTSLQQIKDYQELIIH
jgi:CDP-glucose 4,6-dehydratase